MTSVGLFFFPEEMLSVEIVVPHECGYHFIKSLSDAAHPPHCLQ
jgi:hypothetical protein